MKTDKLSLINIFIFLFILSTLFPIVASLVKVESMPVWIGITDVLLAGIVVTLMTVIATKARERIDSQIKEQSSNIYQAFAIVPLILLVLFFVFGNNIKWEILLPGLAWRAWVLLYSLPSIIALK